MNHRDRLSYMVRLCQLFALRKTKDYRLGALHGFRTCETITQDEYYFWVGLIDESKQYFDVFATKLQDRIKSHPCEKYS